MTEQKRILIAVMITSFIGPFMGSSVNIAVPAMAEDFNMMPDELTWAVTAFLIGSPYDLTCEHLAFVKNKLVLFFYIPKF